MATPNSHRRNSKQALNLRLITPLVGCVFTAIIICALSITVYLQGRREIVSDDFTKPRPTPTPRPVRAYGNIELPKRKPEPRPAKRYRFVDSSSPNAKPFAGEKIEQLGVTLWRLRPAQETDTGARMTVREESKSSEWIPERIEMDTPLSTGDRVRLTIESPREGYLYVVDRDLYSDGKMGDAMLIFPTRGMRGGNNQVLPGRLIDLPGQEDNPNYFTASPRRSAQGSEQVGEILTIVITKTPLKLTIGQRPLLISAVEIANWEKAWGSEFERFEMVDGAGNGWTKEEKEASAANGSRQLTQADPSPQTIYRIASTNKTAFLINVRLKYAGNSSTTDQSPQ